MTNERNENADFLDLDIERREGELFLVLKLTNPTTEKHPMFLQRPVRGEQVSSNFLSTSH